MIIRQASESPSSFEHRLLEEVDRMCATQTDMELRDAAAVYAEGVHAGLSLAIAALQRRERLIDYIARWETAMRARQLRERR